MSAQPIDDALARQHRKDVIDAVNAKIANEAISRPVRVEFQRLPNDDTYVGITQKTKNIWFVDPLPEDKRTNPVKVERLKNDVWTCSHKGWKPKSQCKHISRVRYMLGESDSLVPYDGRRRRLLTKWLFGVHALAEDTRRNRAREAEPKKVVQLAFELCQRFVKQPPRLDIGVGGGGSTGGPLALRIFALLMKVFWNLTYVQLRDRLEDAEPFWELGWKKKKPPCKNAMTNWFGSPVLTPILMALFIETTKPTKRLDSMIIGDSHDMPTRQVDNSRDRKFGPKPASYRNKDRPLVRQHFAVGKISGVITAAEMSLTNGPGSSDNIHLPNLLEQTKAINANVTVAAFDQAYTGRPNFAAAEGLGIDLFVKEKNGEERQSGTWPASAARLAKLESTDPATYAETYRFRSKAEGTPSRIKGRNPFMRLRRRKRDPVVEYPDVPKGTQFSDLPKEVQDAIFDAASADVGIARLNEAWAVLIKISMKWHNRSKKKPTRFTRRLFLLPLTGKSSYAFGLVANPIYDPYEEQFWDSAC